MNPATGPVSVRGAEPGDSLVVEILDIRPGPQGVATIIPGYGQLIDLVESPVTKVLPVRDGVVHFNDEIRFPVRSMVGVVGVATEGEEITNAMPGKHGGNLDDHLHGIGTKIYFPVRQPGGMFAVGDMHASMGDGEICGTATPPLGALERTGRGRGSRSTTPRVDNQTRVGLPSMRVEAVLKVCAISIGPTSPSACSSATNAFKMALKGLDR